MDKYTKIYRSAYRRERFLPRPGHNQFRNAMIEKVTLQLTDRGELLPVGAPRCEEMTPKALLLYAGAKCGGLSALNILRKERISPKRFEITMAGEITTETVHEVSVFSSFHVVYNVECGADDQVKVSRAVKLAHEKYCSMVRMLSCIAPVTHEIAIVSTEPAKG